MLENDSDGGVRDRTPGDPVGAGDAVGLGDAVGFGVAVGLGDGVGFGDPVGAAVGGGTVVFVVPLGPLQAATLQAITIAASANSD